MCQDKLSKRWVEGEAIYSATCAQHQLRNNLLCKFSTVEYLKKKHNIFRKWHHLNPVHPLVQCKLFQWTSYPICPSLNAKDDPSCHLFKRDSCSGLISSLPDYILFREVRSLLCKSCHTYSTLQQSLWIQAVTDPQPYHGHPPWACKFQKSVHTGLKGWLIAQHMQIKLMWCISEHLWTRCVTSDNLNIHEVVA